MSGTMPTHYSPKKQYEMVAASLRSDANHRLARRSFQVICENARVDKHSAPKVVDSERGAEALHADNKEKTLALIEEITSPQALSPGKSIQVVTYLTSAVTQGIPYAVNSAVGVLGPADKSNRLPSPKPSTLGLAVVAAFCSSSLNTVLTAAESIREVAALTRKFQKVVQDIKGKNLTCSDFKHWLVNGVLVSIVLPLAIPSAATLSEGFLAACGTLANTASPLGIQILSSFTYSAILSSLIKLVQTAFLAKAAVAGLRRNFLDHWGLTGGDGGALENWKIFSGIVNASRESPEKTKALNLFDRAFQVDLIGGSSYANEKNSELDDQQKLALLELAFKDARSSENFAVRLILQALRPKYSKIEWLWKNKLEILNYSFSLLLMLSLTFGTASSINELYKTKTLDLLDQTMWFLWIWPQALLNPWVAAVTNAIQIPLYLDFVKRANEEICSCLLEPFRNTKGLKPIPRVLNTLKDIVLGGYFFMTMFNAIQIENSGVKGENYGSQTFMNLMVRLVPPAAFIANAVTYLTLRKFMDSCLDRLGDCFRSCFSKMGCEISPPSAVKAPLLGGISTVFNGGYGSSVTRSASGMSGESGVSNGFAGTREYPL